MELLTPEDKAEIAREAAVNTIQAWVGGGNITTSFILDAMDKVSAMNRRSEARGQRRWPNYAEISGNL